MSVIEIMKMQLEQKQELKQTLFGILEAFKDLIIRLTEFVVIRNIELFELFLFCYAAGRAGWYMTFGVTTLTFDYFFSDAAWTGYFVLASVSHCFGFFFADLRVRIAANVAYAMAYGMLTFLAAVSHTTAPAVPGYLVLFGFSFAIIVRLVVIRQRAR